jgi:class 3 adenylate cyclase
MTLPNSSADDLHKTIALLEAQRPLLGDQAGYTALVALRQQLIGLEQPAPNLTGERKLLTVMVADISGFTALSEALDPEQVRRLMNTCFDALTPIITHYGGTIDKYMGDAIMALFGAPSLGR